MRRGVPSALLWALILALSPLWLLAEEADQEIEWELSGQARFRPEYREDADLNRDEDDVLRQGFMRLRLGVAVTVKKDYRVFVQAQDSRVAGEEESTASNEENLDLHQGYLEVKKTGVEGLSLIIGRQEWSYGDQRLVGAFDWNNVGRSFDGIKLRYAHQDQFWVDGLLAQESNRVEATSIPGSSVSSGSELYGVYFHTGREPGTEYEAYYLGFSNQDSGPGERPGTSGDTQVNALGGRAKDRFGRLDCTLEAVVQSGEVNGDDLSALAGAAVVGWNWGTEGKARVFGGYDYATGDEDPTDGNREEFFNFFPTNHLHYGYIDYEGWRNIRSYYVGYSLRRHRHYGEVKLHRFALEEERGPWKSAGGTTLEFDPTGASGRSVGSEVDFTYKFAWLDNASVAVGVSRFEPGRFARRTRGGDTSDWGYVMLTFGF